MKRKRFTEEKINSILKENEAGVRVRELAPVWGCGENGMPLEVEVFC